MTEFKLEKLVDAPRSEVWQKLSDFGNVHVFHPMVEKSTLHSAVKCGVGAKRTCEFYNGQGHVDEEVTGWKEGESMTVAIRDGSMPLKEGVVHFDLKDAGQGKTLLTLSVHFEMKGGIFGKIMGPVMMRPMMRKMLGQVVDGLEKHLRTGKYIGLNGKLEPGLS
ncbi:MAG: SRPBCC family protein [Nitrospinae bacterium]|nr:SRPBCC family protein [Nitrospinota bacterium]